MIPFRSTSSLRALLVAVLCVITYTATAKTEDWLPISSEELQMSAEPLAPAAPAIYLYRQVDRDDANSVEYVYERIKILTEQGREFGDVRLPYIKSLENIDQIEARVLQPDGTIADFKGEVFNKQLMRVRGIDMAVKSFTLPNVRLGSIVEYRFRHKLRSGYVVDSQWLLTDRLFTRFAKFSLKPYKGYLLRVTWPIGLPDGTNPPRREEGLVLLETRNVPAFVTEEFAPPAETMRLRVDFVYDAYSTVTDPVRYWNDYAKYENGSVEEFIRDRKALERMLAQIVQPTDSPEEKARKIYGRLQQLLNLSYAPQAEREERTPPRNAQQLWEKGYGREWQIARLLYGLLRSAGLDAHYVVPAPRDRGFFDPRLMNGAKLVGALVRVQLGDREIFLDVGSPRLPFGELPWNMTQTRALEVSSEGGTWIRTPLPPPSAASIVSKGMLKLDSSGGLEGRITVTYSGIEAWQRRFDSLNDDEAERKRFLEEDVGGDLPPGVELKLVNSPEWKDAQVPLVAEFDFKVAGWATAAGRNSLLPIGLFGASYKNTFKHADRVHPIYFEYPYLHTQDIAIELPAGWQVGNVPKPRSADRQNIRYSLEARDESGVLRVKRELMMNIVLVNADQYPALREFFQTVRAGDEDQVLLSMPAQSASQPSK